MIESGSRLEINVGTEPGQALAQAWLEIYLGPIFRPKPDIDKIVSI